MQWKSLAYTLLGCFTGMLGSDLAEAKPGDSPVLFRTKKEDDWQKIQAASLVPLDQIAPQFREKVREVLQSPTIYTKGPQESFICEPRLYFWLLDYPDRTAVAWRRLGAQCLEIDQRGPGVFGWTDDQGSNLAWQTVYPGPDRRVWYAEGRVKPGRLLPAVPVQCVVIFKHQAIKEKDGGAVMQHQADVFVRTNSRTAALVTRLLGPSIPRLAEHGVAQLQMFFGAMAWYCHRNPQQAPQLLRPAAPNELPASSRLLSPFEESSTTPQPRIFRMSPEKDQ